MVNSFSSVLLYTSATAANSNRIRRRSFIQCQPLDTVYNARISFLSLSSMPFLWEYFLLQGDLTHRARRAQRKNRGSWRLCAKLHWRCAIRSGDIGLYNHVVKPHEQRCSHTDSCESPPHLGGAVHNFPVIMHQASAQPSPHE